MSVNIFSATIWINFSLGEGSTNDIVMFPSRTGLLYYFWSMMLEIHWNNLCIGCYFITFGPENVFDQFYTWFFSLSFATCLNIGLRGLTNHLVCFWTLNHMQVSLFWLCTVTWKGKNKQKIALLLYFSIPLDE